MPRVCVINVAGVSSRLLAACGRNLWMKGLASRPAPMAATFPVVAASVQASMTTGVEPGLHGVIAGGIFRRQCRTLSLGERSNTLLNEKRFWYASRLPRRLKVSLLFWSNPLAGAADLVVGALTYEPAGSLIADCPKGLYQQLSRQIGPFDPQTVRGPGASWRGSRWIGEAAEILWRRNPCDLQWVYLPGVNFEIVRHGCDSPQALEALSSVDQVAQRLAGVVAESGGQTILVSDGGYVPVERAAYPNLALRRAGLLQVAQTPRGEVLDLVNSRAVVLVDHQVGHLFCMDQEAAAEADEIIAADPAVARTASRDEFFCPGLGHDRSGERIVLAHPDSWLCYQWWEPDGDAPALAQQSDAEGKCGYDPCELFAGKAIGTIDPRPSLVRASRGLTTAPLEDQCVLGSDGPLEMTSPLPVTALPRIVTGALFGPS